MSLMAGASLLATMQIDPHQIDHRAARGLAGESREPASGFSVLITSTPLMVLGLTVAIFHFGNAAMLPLLGQAWVAHGGAPSAFTSATIVIAQLTMIATALLASKLARARGYWIVFLVALIALPIRGMFAAFADGLVGLGPVQILDGVGAGMLGVAVPGLVARILAGSGHVNAGLGAVMTVQGIGAALSPAFAGMVAERFGYSAAFFVLGLVAAAALVVWIVTRPITAEACGDTPANMTPEAS